MSLTTRYLYKQWCGKDDDRLDQIVPQVSAIIGTFLHRTFALTVYRKWLDGTGDDKLLLPEWPITRIYGISTSAVSVMRVKNTGAK